MKYLYLCLLLFEAYALAAQPSTTIAFGSCNNQKLPNALWGNILSHTPQLWVWGGDNIYADTYDMQKLAADYQKLLQDSGYQRLKASCKVIGTWDDHDYGLNDGGEEYTKKKESQQLFLDFMGVSKTDARRKQEGVYYAETLKTAQGSIKVIVLDTRYFRSALQKDTSKKGRYTPNPAGQGTMLGKKQWKWLERELKNSKADFHLIISSIQVLSQEHGFETWGNMPHERQRLLRLIGTAKAKGVMILSGDRHLSEFSKIEVEGLGYPLIDFTSSGLTHSYSSYTYEPNQYRIGEVVNVISFGLLHFDFAQKKVKMEMRGKENQLLQVWEQQY